MAACPNVQAKLGATQERIKQADVMLEQQRNLISGGITNLEDVDPYEASMRATELMTPFGNDLRADPRDCSDWRW